MAVDFLVVVLTAFLVSVFAVVFLSVFGAVLAVVFEVIVAFLSAFSFFMPAALAILTRADLRREAVFLCKRSFLTALSYSDWTERRFSEVGLDLKSLKACLMDFLMD